MVRANAFLAAKKQSLLINIEFILPLRSNYVWLGFSPDSAFHLIHAARSIALVWINCLTQTILLASRHAGTTFQNDQTKSCARKKPFSMKFRIKIMNNC
jgi:hypothetical protein